MRWVKRSEQMPERGQLVIGYYPRLEYLDTVQLEADLNSKLYWSIFSGESSCDLDCITHWMPLPLPPKPEGDE